MLPKKRFSATIFGAIGNCIGGGGFFYMLAESTNRDDFLSFLGSVRQLLTVPIDDRVTLVTDNHCAHIGPSARAKFAKLNMDALFMPPNSP